jgi:hypothetical protein
VGFAADLVAYLDANWASGTGGTEPSWAKLGLTQEHPTANSCLYEELAKTVTPADLRDSSSEYVTRARLLYKCASRTDAEKKETETQRLCRAKSVTGGVWEVVEVEYVEEGQNFCAVEITCQETKVA